MKILYLGDIGSGQTCLMRMNALRRLGHEALGINTVEPWRQATWLQRQIQRRRHCGSVVDALNDQVIAVARDFRPNLVWADKQEYLRPGTIDELRRLGPRLVHFTPDPYFFLSWKRTPLMDQAIGAFDVLVYCKAYEQSNYDALNKPTIYMPLGYCDQVHRPLVSTDPQWACDVGFLGGWEPRREQMLHKVAITGVDLKIRGGYWDFLRDGRATLRRRIILKQLAGSDRFAIKRDEALSACLQGGEVYADDYAWALTGARIGLGFLRKVCPDQHTTRTFEIPACGSMLLADRTDEHKAFFTEGKEADYFDDDDELVDKVNFYTTHDDARNRIAAAGRQRCIMGRYSYVERMADVLMQIDAI